jgi:hypothetical protein
MLFLIHSFFKRDVDFNEVPATLRCHFPRNQIRSSQSITATLP